MRSTWVKIDLARLSLRLWKSRGHWLSDLDLRQWLENLGCTHSGGAWYLCGNTLTHLQSDEIIEVQMRETIDGITFVSRRRRDSELL